MVTEVLVDIYVKHVLPILDSVLAQHTVNPSSRLVKIPLSFAEEILLKKRPELVRKKGGGVVVTAFMNIITGHLYCTRRAILVALFRRGNYKKSRYVFKLCDESDICTSDESCFKDIMREDELKVYKTYMLILKTADQLLSRSDVYEVKAKDVVQVALGEESRAPSQHPTYIALVCGCALAHSYEIRHKKDVYLIKKTKTKISSESPESKPHPSTTLHHSSERVIA